MTSEPVVCEGCGRLATGRRADARYCSAACRQASYRARKAEAEAPARRVAEAKAAERARIDDLVCRLLG
jgi:hypothetical protein